MVHLVHYLIFFISQHPQLAILFSFIFAFLESVAIVGLFIPGSTILIMIGSLIGTHILLPTAIVISSVLGAIGGDSFSYWLGRRYYQVIRSVWPLVYFATLLTKGEQFFIKDGGKSVFFSRFIGPLRPIMPIIAGIMQQKSSRFFLADILSALIWVPAHILLGVIIGRHIMAIAPHHTGKIIAAVTSAILLIWVMYWCIRSLVLYYIFRLNRRINWQNSLPFLFKNLPHSSTSHHHSQRWLALGIFISTVAFLLMCALVSLPIDINSINLPLNHLLASVHTPFLDGLMICFTQLGESKILLPLAILVGLYFVQQHQTRLAWHWLGLMIMVPTIVTLTKQLVHYPRPAHLALKLNYLDSFSFPSEHVAMAVTFWGFLAFIFARQFTHPKQRLYIEALVSLIISSVAFSRLYLGVHWLTDVIASLMLGVSCLSVTIFSYYRQVSSLQPIAVKPLAIIVIAGFSLLTGLFLQQNFVKQYHHLLHRVQQLSMTIKLTKILPPTT